MKYSLGLAANYSPHDIFSHLFTFPNKSAPEQLKMALAQKYHASNSQIQLFHTGRAALTVGLSSTLPKNAQILISGFTCIAVLEAIRNAGCQPVFLDINLKTLHFDAKILAQALKKYPKAKALLIQNTLGYPVDLKPIEQLAKKHQLLIIEDLAHAIAGTYPDGRQLGAVGDLVIFSFGKTKALDVVSGGALILRGEHQFSSTPTKLPKLSDRLRDRFYPLFGLIARKLSLIHLEKPFLALFFKLRLIQRSADASANPDLQLPSWQAKLIIKKLDHSKSPLRDFYFVHDRESVLRLLSQKGYCFPDFWYETPISPARYYQSANFPAESCPNAVFASQHIINLPRHYSKSELSPALKIIKEYLCQIS